MTRPINRRVHLAFAAARRPLAAAVKNDQCAAGRLKTDAKTKVHMGWGMVFGKTMQQLGDFSTFNMK